MPNAQPVAGPEDTATVNDPLVAGRLWVQVGHVWWPTMTVYSPKGKNTGACGCRVSRRGYWILAINLEGTEVGDWLTSTGITCVLLKYRVPGEHLSPRSGPYPNSPMALEDAQRTLGLVRFHARVAHRSAQDGSARGEYVETFRAESIGSCDQPDASHVLAASGE